VPHLLDTHTFLWWITDDHRLPPTVRQLIASPDHSFLFSAASAWEMAIKAQLGRLDLPNDLGAFIEDQLAANGFVPLPITVRHALQVRVLPALHRDPFDRILVAQAIVEDVPLISVDRLVAQYPVRTIW